MKMAESSPNRSETLWGKGEIVRYEFTVVSKGVYCRHFKTRACSGKGFELNFLSSDKQLDSSVNSNSTSSVLDQVYSICVEEDKIRSEINSVDAKMEKLKSLISEAEKQIESFFERRIEVRHF